jgi:NAD-dependent DNA ligase
MSNAAINEYLKIKNRPRRKNVCITGRFLGRTQEQVSEAIKAMGMRVVLAVREYTDVLVVGELGNANWLHLTYGTKITAARGMGVEIVTEKEFFGRKDLA